MTSLTLVRTKAEETTHQPLQKRALHSSNDSEDEVASLMSVSEAINELEDAYLKKKKEKEVFSFIVITIVSLFDDSLSKLALGA